ncbi:MAG: GAF domain-containing protein [Haloarculaceae archaeon]
MADAAVILDLGGAVLFFVAAAVAVRLYQARPLFRDYWLSWVLAMSHLGLWAVAVALGALGVGPPFVGDTLALLLLTVGLAALLHIALYDNTGSEALLRRVRTSEARNSRLVEHYPDGAVALYDADRRVLLAGGHDLLGLDRDPADLEGERLGEALPAAAAAAVEMQCRDALGGAAESGEITVAGSTYETRAVPVVTDGGALEGLLVVSDVTEQRRRERLLREQRDELATLDRINAIVRDVDRVLVSADTREGIARAVAERLAADEPYRGALLAWLDGDDRLVPAARAGPGDGALGAVPDALGAADADVGARAVESGAIAVLEGVSADSAGEGWHESARALGARAVAVVPIRYDERTFGVVAAYADREDAFDERERAVLDQFGETIGYALAAVERRERVDVLAALHRATRELLHTESPAAVGEVVVAAGTEVLDVEIAVFAYDEDAHELRPVATSERALEFYEDDPVYRGDDRQALTWRTFAEGETAVFDDVRSAGSLGNPETDARSAMFVPLGEHGVLVAGTTVVGAFDEPSRQLVDLLAAATEAAFDRQASDAERLARERQLTERNEALAQLQAVNDVIRDVTRAVVAASSRPEIEAAVCERLTDEGRYAFAWIGERRDGEVRPRTWAGEGASYLDAASFAPEGAFPEPAARAASEREPIVVSALTNHLRRADWVGEALEFGFGSVVSLPVSYRDLEYGVLTVYAPEADAFDEETTAVLSELAGTVAAAVDAREIKRGLLASGGTELKRRLPEARSALNEIARRTDSTVTVIETRPAGEGATQVFFRAPGMTPETASELATDLVAVEELAPVSDQADERRYRATVTDGAIVDAVVEFGAVPREIEATAAETTLVVSLLPHVDARAFVDRLAARFSDVELVARRERGRPSQSIGAFREEFESVVTERQLEVLSLAYERGYFESPRESTGQDLADALGVSQPTINHHLRVSQRRLLALLFDAEGDGNDEAAP